MNTDELTNFVLQLRTDFRDGDNVNLKRLEDTNAKFNGLKSYIEQSMKELKRATDQTAKTVEVKGTDIIKGFNDIKKWLEAEKSFTQGLPTIIRDFDRRIRELEREVKKI